jgi:uncharacterized membrane protein HdeD (DUF308 family)
MSNHVTPSLRPVAPTLVADTAGSTLALRRLYYARFAFALVWAGLVTATATTLTPVSIALLVLYPLVDVAAAVLDARSSGPRGPRGPLLLNMALSLLAVVALAVAVSSGLPSVLRVWGAWAIAAGVVQLIVALQRQRLGGQWALVLSGAISTLAGTGFILMAAGPEASLTGLAGYAALGGVFFLISATRLHRSSKLATGR